MEEYQFTDLVVGDRHSHTFQVTVEERQTTVHDLTPPDTTTETPVEDTTVYVVEATTDYEVTTKINENDQEGTNGAHSDTITFQSLPLEVWTFYAKAHEYYNIVIRFQMMVL